MVHESCPVEVLLGSRSSMRMKSKQRLNEISRIRDDYIKLIENGLADETVLSEDLERLAREEKNRIETLSKDISTYTKALENVTVNENNKQTLAALFRLLNGVCLRCNLYLWNRCGRRQSIS